MPRLLWFLLPALLPLTPLPLLSDTAVLAQTAPAQQGSQLELDGRPLAAAWEVREGRVWLSEAALRGLGAELKPDLTGQVMVRWFPGTGAEQGDALVRSPWGAQVLYDATALLQRGGISAQPQGDRLQLVAPAVTLTGVRRGRQPAGQRWVLDFDRPLPWQWQRDEGAVRLTFRGQATAQAQMQARQLGVRLLGQGDRVELELPLGETVTVSAASLGGPNRIYFDASGGLAESPATPTAAPVLRVPGLVSQRMTVPVGSSRFPVNILRLDLRQPGLRVLPVWAGGDQQQGTQTLALTLRREGAIAGINAGFFNRNNRLPLGAIRRDGTWFSGPILGRGAIAWDEQGNVSLGRLDLREQLVTEVGGTLPVLLLNTGYARAGLARYTPAWGTAYRPVTEGERVAVVRGDRVVTLQPVPPTGVAIPVDGYLIVARAAASQLAQLTPGMGVRVEQQVLPATLGPQPHLVQAGPLLVSGGQVVLDARGEGFSAAFANERAPRSAVGRMPDGSLLLVTAHEDASGYGPSLGEMARLMVSLGAADALNFDGGSSTTLVLDEQPLNRPGSSVARVHNGLAVFYRPEQAQRLP